jgi:hypothetical protein
MFSTIHCIFQPPHFGPFTFSSTFWLNSKIILGHPASSNSTTTILIFFFYYSLPVQMVQLPQFFFSTNPPNTLLNQYSLNNPQNYILFTRYSRNRTCTHVVGDLRLLIKAFTMSTWRWRYMILYQQQIEASKHNTILPTYPQRRNSFNPLKPSG